MLNSQIDYASLVEKALLRVVHDVLGMVAEQGLPGRHHLYITFRTDHPGVVIDDALHARYPNEMTIVLQHEFWGLEVSDDRFSVTLKFNNIPHRLEIPMAAVTVFADPSVEFGLQFTRGEPALRPEPPEAPGAVEKPGEDGIRLAPAPIDPPRIVAEPAARQAEGPAEQAADQTADQAKNAEKVVTLDRFRKK